MASPADNDVESVKNIENEEQSPVIKMTSATSFSASNVAETSRFGGLRAREDSAVSSSGRKTGTNFEEQKSGDSYHHFETGMDDAT